MSEPVNVPTPANHPCSTLQGASIATFWSSTFDPYNYAKVRDLYSYEENSFFDTYEVAYKTNNFVFMLVEYLVTATLGDGFHFEGDGAEDVEQFFKEDGTRAKLEMVFRDAVRYGNGMMDYGSKGGKVVMCRVLDPKQIEIELQDDPNKSKYGERIYKQGDKKLNEEAMFHMMLFEFPAKAWGMSPLRPNIYFCQALYDVGGDVFAAIKRAAYSPIDAALDLDSYATDTEKEEAINSFKRMLENLESATNNVVHDRRHVLTLLSSGTGNARMMPVNEMIEPWLAMCLRSFGMPLGIFLQQGANKANLEAQREDVRAYVNLIRRRFAEQVEGKMLLKMGKPDVRIVWNQPTSTSPEMQSLMNVWVGMFQAGIVSREAFLDQFDIIDSGTTLVPLPTLSQDANPDAPRKPTPANIKSNPAPPAKVKDE